MKGTVLKTVGLPPAPQWFGVHSAVVYANNDPLSQNRVILQIPQVMGTALSNWADPLLQNFTLPAVGTYVLACFLGGDINKPAYFPTPATAIPAISNSPVQIIVGSTSTQGLGIEVTADTGERLAVTGDGTLHWGTGTGATDTTLGRGNIAGQVSTPGTFISNTAIQTFGSMTEFVANNSTSVFNIITLFEANSRYYIEGSGKVWWGPGGSTAVDTNLYRGAANQIKTDSAIQSTGGTVSNPTLIKTDTWHSLGTLGAHYSVTLGRYRLTTDNCVELDIHVTGDGLQATTVSFANTLPAAYQPVYDHTTLPMGTTRQTTAGDISPRLSVFANGTVSVINQGTANDFACCVRVPLDP